MSAHELLFPTVSNLIIIAAGAFWMLLNLIGIRFFGPAERAGSNLLAVLHSVLHVNWNFLLCFAHFNDESAL
jgi:hypothetical protein